MACAWLAPLFAEAASSVMGYAMLHGWLRTVCNIVVRYSGVTIPYDGCGYLARGIFAYLVSDLDHARRIYPEPIGQFQLPGDRRHPIWTTELFRAPAADAR
eukprot:5765627-Pyramimonas_sp.AAC.1